MTYINYQFEDIFSSRILQLKLHLIRAISFWHSLIPHKSFKTGIIKKLDNRLTSIYFISEGLLVNIKERSFTQKEAEESHASSLIWLSKSKNIYSELDKISSILNLQVKETADKTLENFYEIEFLLRKAAYSNKPLNEDDKSLQEFASHLSLNSLP